MNLSAELSRDEYYDFVSKYVPSIYEQFALADNRFKKDTYYSHICQTRCFLTYREIRRKFSTGDKVVDLGMYPGTFLRQLKTLLGDDILCYGVGHKIDNKFKEYMGEYLKDCADIELDPFYLKSTEKVRIPFESNTFKFVVATEILEHLISPLELIAEGSRILKTGGLFIITTPNVSHIGAVLRMLAGKSNYERLHRSPMYLQNDPWRGHIRFYDKKELITLFNEQKCKLVRHSYYREDNWNRWNIPIYKKIIRGIAHLIPIYREGHFAVFQKTN